MTYSSVFVDKSPASVLEPDLSEVFRYLGYTLKDRTNLEDEVHPIVTDVVQQFKNLMIPQSVYVCYPLKVEDDVLIFHDNRLKSRDLSRYLKECTAVYLFAATLGPKVDQQIQRMQKLDPVRAVCMQATGAMYIEKYCDYLCDLFKEEAAKDGFVPRHRFSPGFGDVPLETQKLFFSLLDCSKKIGLTLMDTLIMAPEKSVTAFVGLKKED